ncbi:MAG: terpene cyclase/mutase family protein [Planctomycetaceae bacterium]|nr:terpene cyclase/mutase family protein [Planctomycetaceae bacterium]
MNDKNENNSDNKVIESDAGLSAGSDSLASGLFFISVTEKDFSVKSRKKIKKPSRQPQNIFSDETALWLISLIKGKKNQVDSVEFNESESSDNLRNDNSRASNIPKRDAQDALAAAIRERCLPCFWSMFIHLCILIILAILFLPTKKNEIIEIIVTKNPAAEELISAIAGITKKNNEAQPAIISPPIDDVPPPDSPTLSQHTITNDVSTVTIPFDGKPTLSISSERKLMKRNETFGGSNSSTDAAIRAALDWLVQNQNPDGSWDLCGPYKNGAPYNKENKIAATAMALLALQGYGITPELDEADLSEYIQPSRNGWRWLLARQDKNGCFFDDKLPINDRFYTHGLCTIAICERIAMTNNEEIREEIREAAIRAVEYCVRHQSVEGGWRYAADRYGAGSDVSVTGWIVMALMAAEMAKIPVEKNVFENVNKFLDSVAQDGGSKYSYRNARGEGVRKSMTAEALFCRELIGWKRTDIRLTRGLNFLVEPENLPTFKEHYNRNAYYWFYASLALYNYGGEIWSKWDKAVKKALLENQEKRGKEKGSWDPNKPVADEWGRQYGRLYTTCLSIFILETNYRYKPIYGN